MEVLRLRVKDVDGARSEVLIGDGKASRSALRCCRVRSNERCPSTCRRGGGRLASFEGSGGLRAVAAARAGIRIVRQRVRRCYALSRNSEGPLARAFACHEGMAQTVTVSATSLNSLI